MLTIDVSRNLTEMVPTRKYQNDNLKMSFKSLLGAGVVPNNVKSLEDNRDWNIKEIQNIVDSGL